MSATDYAFPSIRLRRALGLCGQISRRSPQTFVYDGTQSGRERIKAKRFNKNVNAANTYFAIQSTAWVILFEANYEKDDYPGTASSKFDHVKELLTSSKFLYLDSLNKALSAIVLIFNYAFLPICRQGEKAHSFITRKSYPAPCSLFSWINHFL